MPHIIIEHDQETASEIELSKLCHALHKTLSEQETVNLEAIKTRTIEVKNSIVAKGINNKLLHIEVRLLTGRSESLKEEMASAIFTRAKEFLSENQCALSVNISELGVYKK